MALFSIAMFSQEHAWVYFKDKPGEATYLANPLTMLSQRAIDRRNRQNISLDYKDVPIFVDYINQVDAQSGVEVKAKSKWLNAVHIIGMEVAVNNLTNLSFVDHIEFAASGLNLKSESETKHISKFEELTDYNYGSSENQVAQLGVDFLHQNDFTGDGIQIAVIDAGFPNVDTFAAFEKIRANNQILGGYNFVARSNNFYTSNRHGMSVLSTIAGFVDGELVGTAPDASFYLFITEDVTSETPLEESLWVEAAEKADSLGVDIINTSLGYHTFDEAKYNHDYSKMDGNSLFVTRGANIAVSRGMIVVIAAGNDGNNAIFNHIGVPSNATSVLAVGAVDENNMMASFSSYGPTIDGRIKPDIDAKGYRTTVVNTAGNVATGNGTSYAAPVMTGAIASFWQAFPYKTNLEIIQMVKESAHLYHNPTNHAGYGTPNFRAAYEKEISIDDLSVYPNPTKGEVLFRYDSSYKSGNVYVYDLLGKLLMDYDLSSSVSLNLNNFEKGIYFLHFNSKFGDPKVFKIIKK